MNVIKCQHCKKVYFEIDTKEECPHCGKTENEIPDFLKDIVGGK